MTNNQDTKTPYQSLPDEVLRLTSGPIPTTDIAAVRGVEAQIPASADRIGLHVDPVTLFEYLTVTTELGAVILLRLPAAEPFPDRSKDSVLDLVLVAAEDDFSGAFSFGVVPVVSSGVAPSLGWRIHEATYTDSEGERFHAWA